MRPDWRVWILLGLVLTATVVAWLWPDWRVCRIERSLEQVRVGDDSAEVHRLLGRPWKDEACGAIFGGQPVGCVQEFVYAHPYAPYAPEYWIVYLDANRKVLDKAHLVSP